MHIALDFFAARHPAGGGKVAIFFHQHAADDLPRVRPLVDELIEHAIVYGDYKGIPKQQVREALASGMDVVMRIDVQGAETVRKLAPEALMIFITTESEAELVHRLETRKTETADSLAIRIATARKELKRLEAFDYVIVNKDFHLDHTVDMIRAIIDAEHHRVKPRNVTL